MRTCAGYPPADGPGQTVTLPDGLAAAPADEDGPPGVSPVLLFPYAAEDGKVSTRRPAWGWAGTSTAIRGTAAPPGI